MVGEFLLPLRELLQLLQRLIDLLLLLLLLAVRLRLIALVLILFGIELEIEEAFHIACTGATAAATAAVLAAERYLDIAGRSLGTHQVLQGFLLVR